MSLAAKPAPSSLRRRSGPTEFSRGGFLEAPSTKKRAWALVANSTPELKLMKRLIELKAAGEHRSGLGARVAEVSLVTANKGARIGASDARARLLQEGARRRPAQETRAR